MPRRAVLLVAILFLTIIPITDAQTSRPAYIFEQLLTVSADAIVVSPDLHTFITRRDVSSINIYQLLASRWLDIAGIILLLTTFILLRRSHHLYKLRHLVGQSYCRNCRYLLTALTSDRCPECGTVLTSKSRRIGRPVRRKIAFALTFLTLTWPAWAFARFYLPPPFTAEWHGPELYSDSLAAFARRYDINWLEKRIETPAVLSQWNADNFTLTRVLMYYNQQFASMITFSSDSRSVYISQTDAIKRFDLATGRRSQTNPMPPNLPVHQIVSPVIFPDGKLQYISDKILVRWDLQSGHLLSKMKFPPQGYYDPVERGPGKGYVMFHRTRGLPALGTFDENGVLIRHLELLDTSAHEWDATPCLLTQDGNTCFTINANDTEQGICRWNLQNGDTTFFPLKDVAGVMALSANDEYLLVVTAAQKNPEWVEGIWPSNSIDIYHAATSQFVRHLDFPALDSIHEIIIAPDNRHAILIDDYPASAGTHLLRIDLQDILTAPPPTSLPTTTRPHSPPRPPRIFQPLNP